MPVTTPPTIRRWSVLWGSVAILMCTGAIYAFSVFAGPLSALHGWSGPQVILAFTINGAIAPIPMILGGFIIDRGSSRLLVLVGGLMFAVGFILAGLSTTTTALYLSYGLLAGLGQGFAYSACLNNTLKLFPDRRGQAAGIITGGMGAATVIAAPVANALISSYSVTTAFVAMGSVYAVVVVIASFFIRQAPVGYTPDGWVRPVSDGSPVNLGWTAMLRTPVFYLIFLMMGLGAFSGLMITANAAGIGKGMFALSAATAAVYVSIYSACNAAGRVVWGAVSDRIGYTNALLMIFGVVAASMLVLVTVSSTAGFAIGIVGLGLCFGGVMGVFPALTMKSFGPRFQGINYGIMFTAYSVAAFFAPKLAAEMGKTHNGDFTIAFVISIGLAIAGLLVTLVFTRVQKSHLDALSVSTPAAVPVAI
jgi:OFA family oxalate/formate antiporter-like MFS transporter